MRGSSLLVLERMRRGISQKAFAEATGINAATLCLIERRRLVPRAGHKEVILSALGAAESDFFGPNGLAL